MAAARELAETMVQLGEAHGVRTTALLTAMDTPLGRTAGNALEVAEALEVLEGGGPPDLVEVTLALAREMLVLAGIDAEPAAALSDGRALEVFRQMVRAQGGDPDAPLPVAATRHQVAAAASGYVHRLDARAVGVAAWRLGAGRSRKEDPVSPSAGVVCLAKPGDKVAADQPVLELHVDDPSKLAGALEALEGAITIADEPPAPASLVIDRVTAG
jgi:thymidine phosphorylase